MQTNVNATDSHARRPHEIDDLVSPALRDRLAELDPLLDLDRVVRMIRVQRAGRRLWSA